MFRICLAVLLTVLSISLMLVSCGTGESSETQNVNTAVTENPSLAVGESKISYDNPAVDQYVDSLAETYDFNGKRLPGAEMKVRLPKM